MNRYWVIPTVFFAMVLYVAVFTTVACAQLGDQPTKVEIQVEQYGRWLHSIPNAQLKVELLRVRRLKMATCTRLALEEALSRSINGGK